VFVLLLVILMPYYCKTMDAHAEAGNASTRPRPGLSGEHRSWPGGSGARAQARGHAALASMALPMREDLGNDAAVPAVLDGWSVQEGPRARCRMCWPMYARKPAVQAPVRSSASPLQHRRATERYERLGALSSMLQTATFVLLSESHSK
jgi:hypothetical protein